MAQAFVRYEVMLICTQLALGPRCLVYSRQAGLRDGMVLR